MFFNKPQSIKIVQPAGVAECLSVSLGNTFDFVLLLNSIAVGGTLGSVHEFISKTFSHGLDVAESSFTSLFISSFHLIL